MQVMSDLLSGYRDFLSVTAVADSSHVPPETADRMVFGVTDVSINATTTVDLCVEFDRKGFLVHVPVSYRVFLDSLLRSQGFINLCEDGTCF